jgi:hypothetical protein
MSVAIKLANGVEHLNNHYHIFRRCQKQIAANAKDAFFSRMIFEQV